MAANITQLTPTQREFRTAMANLSAGVNIVTTDGPRGRAGITVSAVCSVTDSPPTMLVCVNRSSRSHDVLRANERVCINVLGPEHQDVALAFAGSVPPEERFSVSADVWDHSVAAVPVLKGSAASIVGRITGSATQGSHSVLFVEADRVIVGEDSGGLVYFQRRFHPISTALGA
ncbi:4-hydroxyphenylacetate 3-monooxygenase reductase component [Streptomyces humidus]|uniref:4-hydroxyphenylacetate 3-monooxygenase reductase component n=1 Tax=Streptomyces humidus TaxID=52259 RepID=A0A918L9S3_9ACTN|nr:flavin reductase [Streptomyces humidus]GGS23519.1 4-hydroxyphenylacetate 3-monooxygenase reductase component [Streptomyces humidus]